MLLCSSALCVDLYDHAANSHEPAAVFEGGKLYQQGSLKVLELHGSYHQMGRQYGALLKTELNEIYENMSNESDEVGALGNISFPLYPQRYKEILYGMAETSGLGLDKLMIVNDLQIYLLHVQGCSAIAAWGNYTSCGPLVVGRNYDWSDKMRQYVVVAVFNPDDGSIPVAGVHYAGSIYINTGLNRAGIFLETNGDTSESVFCTNRVTTPIQFFSFLEDCARLDQIEGHLLSTKPTDGCIVNVADGKEARSYEWTVYDLKPREPDQDGLLVSTNHFLDPSWGFEPPSIGARDPIRTAERRRNLLALAELCKGRFNPQVMMQIMSIPLESGGALQTSGLPTSYQVVAVPEELKMWVRIPGVQEWTELEMERFFA
ncbi:MAG: C45 family autoproteolytic acyltransferase/hydrolase [Methanothrix sp.]|nr:C45 family autoproteolytic acyltransferase/hydrolase [Methanothrix sp.]